MPDPVTGTIAGVGGLGLIGSLYGANKASKVQGDAIDAASSANAASLAAQMRMYYQQREDFEPFRNLGTDTLGRYYAMIGEKPFLGPAQEQLLDTYRGKTGEQIPEALRTQVQNAREKEALLMSIERAESDPVKMSPAGQWTLREALKTQNRQDAARGLAGTGSASARTGELAAQVAANDWNQQYARILDALKIGTGAAQATGGASQTASNAIGQSGAMSGNLALASGANQASYYSGLGGAIGQAANLGLKAFAPAGGSPWYAGLSLTDAATNNPYTSW